MTLAFRLDLFEAFLPLFEVCVLASALPPAARRWTASSEPRRTGSIWLGRVRRHAPLIGTLLVPASRPQRGALAHTAFAGVASGCFSTPSSPGVSPYLTAVVVAVIAALLIELISEATDAYNDVSMAIVLSTGFALGTVLISLNAGGLAVGINQYLFGNLSTVSAENAVIMLGLFSVIVGTVALTRNQCCTSRSTRPPPPSPGSRSPGTTG